MAAAARAASPIFRVMLSVVLGLMTLIRMRRLPERFELGPDSSRALLIFVGRSRLIAARVAVAPLPIHRGGFAYEPDVVDSRAPRAAADRACAYRGARGRHAERLRLQGRLSRSLRRRRLGGTGGDRAHSRGARRLAPGRDDRRLSPDGLDPGSARCRRRELPQLAQGQRPPPDAPAARARGQADDPGHVGLRPGGRAQARAGGSRDRQAALQRLLLDEPRRVAARARRAHPGLHRRGQQRVRRVHAARRILPGIFPPVGRRLQPGLGPALAARRHRRERPALLRLGDDDPGVRRRARIHTRGDSMNRRRMLLTLIAAVVWPLAATAQDAIKIGAPISMSPPGSVTQGKEVRDGLTLAQQILDKRGGVLRRKIEILYEDTQGIPEKGRAAVEKLITRDKVVAIVGEHASSVTLADIEVAHRYNIPLMNTNAWSDAVRLKGYPQVFNRANYNSHVAEAMGEVIAKMKVKNVVAYAENWDYASGQAELMKKTLARVALDVKFTSRVLDRAAKDFTPAVLPLKSEKPDMVVTIMIPPASYLLMNQLYENGIAPSRQTWLYDGAGVADYPEFWDNVKDAGVGLLSFGLYHPQMTLSPLGKEVRTLYMEQHKREPNRLIFQAADSLFLVADAITRAKSTEADPVIKALRETRFEGSQGTVTFEKEQGLYFQTWKNIPYITYQLTAKGQQLPDTLLIQGPGIELSVDKLMRPAR